ncbi:tRNA pseudouridine(13) synthase TruD [Streptomyces sp. URMC 123]|uniref:tRNA pseudouridine(13) synthase TruD n=1 Tax=Streptomyces sp. URMC 123 TaxID=3423403 RepID=UPI003F19B8BD
MTAAVLREARRPREERHRAVLKHVPEDFRVAESLVLAADPDLGPAPDTSRDTAPDTSTGTGTGAGPYGPREGFRYLRLRKRGYTTFEAIAVVARLLGVDPLGIGHAGLKDEDAVTEQTLSVPAAATENAPAVLEHRDGDRWLTVGPQGRGAAPLRVGVLEGNAFRLVVRDLAPERAEALRERGTFDHFFLNYYDVQRFGVPGGPKRTHLLGRAILDEDWDTALTLLRESGSPEAARAREFTGAAEEFFARLDPRVTAFYRSAWESDRWNARLREAVAEACGGRQRDLTREGVPYAYADSPRSVLAVLAAVPSLPHVRHRWDGDRIVTEHSSRSTVIQTRIRVGEVTDDAYFPGRSSCVLSFFLPSGCYATAAMSQLWETL